MGAAAYRRQINKVLVRLERRYGLIKAKTRFGGDADVELVLNAEAPALGLPAGYWFFGWNRRLDLAGKVMYLLNRYYSAESPKPPRWSLSGETLARRHGLSPWFVRKGTTELRRANLVEVEHGALPAKVTGPRAPNVYTPGPLYDPQVFERNLNGLEVKYGPEKVRRARACAALVYEDGDLGAVERFIELEEEYGREKIKKAFQIIGAKSPDNPRRDVGYFIHTVKNL